MMMTKLATIAGYVQPKPIVDMSKLTMHQRVELLKAKWQHDQRMTALTSKEKHETKLKQETTKIENKLKIESDNKLAEERLKIEEEVEENYNKRERELEQVMMQFEQERTNFINHLDNEVKKAKAVVQKEMDKADDVFAEQDRQLTQKAADIKSEYDNYKAKLELDFDQRVQKKVAEDLKKERASLEQQREVVRAATLGCSLLRPQLEEQKKQIAELTTDNESLQNDNESLEEEKASLQSKFTDAQSVRESLHLELEAAKKKLVLQDVSITSMQSEVQDLQQERDQYKEQAKTYKGHRDELNAECKKCVGPFGGVRHPPPAWDNATCQPCTESEKDDAQTSKEDGAGQEQSKEQQEEEQAAGSTSPEDEASTKTISKLEFRLLHYENNWNDLNQQLENAKSELQQCRECNMMQQEEMEQKNHGLRADLKKQADSKDAIIQELGEKYETLRNTVHKQRGESYGHNGIESLKCDLASKVMCINDLQEKLFESGQKKNDLQQMLLRQKLFSSEVTKELVLIKNQHAKLSEKHKRDVDYLRNSLKEKLVDVEHMQRLMNDKEMVIQSFREKFEHETMRSSACQQRVQSCENRDKLMTRENQRLQKQLDERTAERDEARSMNKRWSDSHSALVDRQLSSSTPGGNDEQEAAINVVEKLRQVVASQYELDRQRFELGRLDISDPPAEWQKNVIDDFDHMKQLHKTIQQTTFDILKHEVDCMSDSELISALVPMADAKDFGMTSKELAKEYSRFPTKEACWAELERLKKEVKDCIAIARGEQSTALEEMKKHEGNKKMVDELQQENTKLESQVEGLTVELSDLNGALQECESDKKYSNMDKVTALERERNSLNNQIDDLRDQIKVLNKYGNMDEVHELTRERNTLQNQMGDLRNKISDLQQQIKDGTEVVDLGDFTQDGTPQF